MFAFFMPQSALHVGVSLAPFASVAMFAAACFVFAPQQMLRNKRQMIAALLVLLVVAIGVAGYASDGDFIIPANCHGLGPSDVLYWLRNCWAF